MGTLDALPMADVCSRATPTAASAYNATNPTGMVTSGARSPRTRALDRAYADPPPGVSENALSVEVGAAIRSTRRATRLLLDGSHRTDTNPPALAVLTCDHWPDGTTAEPAMPTI